MSSFKMERKHACVFMILCFRFLSAEGSCRSCDRVITVDDQSSGFISSPNHPQNYPKNCHCTYRLKARDQFKPVHVVLLDFNLQEGYNGDCRYDYLAIYNNDGDDYCQLAKFCGKVLRQVSMSGNSLTFIFHSDGSVRRGGFLFGYNAGRQSSLGSGPVTTAAITHASWIDTPSIVETTENVFNVLGWKVHLSKVHQLLVDKAKRFPFTQTTTELPRIELIIRADTIYLDQSLVFQGLKKLIIKARKFASNAETLTVKAPKVCRSISSTSACKIMPGKAKDMENGTNGRNGITSPIVKIYVYELQGSIYIVSEGSSGTAGEEGGDGNPGENNSKSVPPLTDSALCNIRRKKRFLSFPIFAIQSCDIGVIQGDRGYPGGDGKDGRKAGLSGRGGYANFVTIYAGRDSGYVNLQQFPGLGGAPAKHGLGGRGGNGGAGGCGMICQRQWISCIATPSCSYRGNSGNPGKAGRDGKKLYSRPITGKSGSIESSDMRKNKSLKSYLKEDSQFLSLIQRHAEFFFQKNDNANATNLFEFILSVASESSTVYQEASLKIRMISQGFDYYGHTNEYAPDLDWSYLHERVDSLLETGQKFEEAYNRVMEKVEDASLFTVLTGSLRSVAIKSLEVEKKQLKNNQLELKKLKNLYVKSIKQLEKTMTMELVLMNQFLPQAMKPDQPDVLGFISEVLSLFAGLGAILKGIFVSEDPLDILNGATKVVDTLRKEPGCNAPTVEEAALTLKERVTFGAMYQSVEPENLDFATMDVSAVPIILRSELSKNKRVIFTELRCLFSQRKKEAVANLGRVIEDFFTDAESRMKLIDRILNIDIQLKKISFSRGLLAETQQMVEETLVVSQEKVSMNVKMLFSDYMYNLYEQQANTITRAIYELSKAYQFSCLWNFNAIEKYNEIFSQEVVASNLGSLEHISELQRILGNLDEQKHYFVRSTRSSAGPISHIYYHHWGFSNDTHPEIIRALHSEGQFTLNLKLDPENPDAAGCDSCYNGRLISLYVEFTGEEQTSTVPNTVYVKVAHMGDSSFLIPLRNNSKGVTLLRQTPEDVDGGHVMLFDRANHVTSEHYLEVLREKLSREDYTLCDESERFFGKRPCKSPYATYVITVPRDDDLRCSLDPRDLVSGTNCRDLDFTRFNGIHIYAKVRSWSNYPMQPDQETLRRFARNLKSGDENE